MRWILLAVAILAELCGSTCMKLSDGFSNLYASILTFVFWGISFSIFIFALKHFDLSFIYAIWAGIGISLVSLIGMTYFREPVNTLKIISILIIAAGVVMLNLSDILSKQWETAQPVISRKKLFRIILLRPEIFTRTCSIPKTDWFLFVWWNYISSNDFLIIMSGFNKK